MGQFIKRDRAEKQKASQNYIGEFASGLGWSDQVKSLLPGKHCRINVLDGIASTG
jgi:hypothetical protein